MKIINLLFISMIICFSKASATDTRVIIISDSTTSNSIFTISPKECDGKSKKANALIEKYSQTLNFKCSQSTKTYTLEITNSGSLVLAVTFFKLSKLNLVVPFKEILLDLSY